MIPATLKVYDYIDIVNAGVNTKSLEQMDVDFIIASQRVYVRPNSRAHTMLSLHGIPNKTVRVQYQIGKTTV